MNIDDINLEPFNSDTVSLAASGSAGDRRKIPAVYRYFLILGITGATSVKVRFGQAAPVPVKARIGIPMPRVFEDFEIINEEASGISVEYSYSIMPVDDQRAGEQSLSVLAAEDWDTGGEIDIDSTVDAADCKIAARSTRKSVLIKNTGTQDLYPRTSSGTGTSPSGGIKIAPGESRVYHHVKEIFFYKHTSLTGQKCEYEEEFD